MPVKRRHIDFDAKASVLAFVKEHTGKREDGLIEYADGWSDGKVAEAMSESLGVEVVEQAVRRIRAQKVGILVSPIRTQPKPVASDNDSLLKLIGELRDDLNAAIRTINRLAIEAGVDGVRVGPKEQPTLFNGGAETA